jgi:sensor c-di-GMP phosphodiesterase-like protein
MNHNTDDDFALDITITLELPGGWTIASIALAALADILTRLEHDGIRPNQTTLEVTETTTP